MIYTLNDRPSPGKAVFAAVQHLMAIFVGIITPPIIVSGALGFDVQLTSYLISMALFASGISTFIQVRKIGPIGSGLLSIQGTSFAFLSTIIMTGFIVKNAGGTQEEMLVTILGVCFFGSFIEMIFSRFIPFLKKIITPLVSGIVVTLIGLSLIQVGIKDIGGGAWLFDNKPDVFGNPRNLLLALMVLVIIIVFNRSRRPWLRMGAIVFGLIAGYIAATAMGLVNFARIRDLSIVAPPIPFRYGFFKFNWAAFLPMSLLYLITTIESMGDLTATSLVSGEPIEGDLYLKRISGGVLGDGVNSAIAALLNSFPNTTFSQNNGVIQMTGVASRYVGYYIAGFLCLLGLFPIIGGIFSIIPNSVLGGATIIMFGTVAASGIRIIASSVINRRGVMIIAISLGMGLGVVFVPQILQYLPDFARQIFSSAITTGGLTAIILSIVLPRFPKAERG